MKTVETGKMLSQFKLRFSDENNVPLYFTLESLSFSRIFRLQNEIQIQICASLFI